MRIRVVFLFEGEGFGDEDIDGCFSVRVAPELEHLHAFVVDPALPLFGVGELFTGDGHIGPIAKGVQCSEGLFDVFREQSQHKIHILGKTQIAVGVNGEPTGHQILYASGIQYAEYLFGAVEFHGLLSLPKSAFIPPHPVKT